MKKLIIPLLFFASTAIAADGGGYTYHGVYALPADKIRLYFEVPVLDSVPEDATFVIVSGTHTAPYSTVNTSFGASSLQYIIVSQNFNLVHFAGETIRPLFWKFEYNIPENTTIYASYSITVSWSSESLPDPVPPGPTPEQRIAAALSAINSLLSLGD